MGVDLGNRLKKEENMPRTLAQLSRQKRVLGFTLLEILMVAAAILILVAIGVPNFVRALEAAKIASARTQLISYKAALQQYHTDTRRWPPSGSEHFYYALAGLPPFNQKSSIRYTPPYYDFDAALVGKPPGGVGDLTLGIDNTIGFFLDRNGTAVQDLGVSDLRPVVPFPGQDGVLFHPVLDPWGRPVLYISPDDLRTYWNNGIDATPWGRFSALSDETRFNDRGEGRHVPFDLEGGQFWSAGPDGKTAPGAETHFGYFQPGNLLRGDGRDNEGDGLSDASDTSVRRRKTGDDNQIAEDDISSW